MLSDRSYMQDDYGRQRTSVLLWTICALIAGFLIQVVFERAINSSHFTTFAALSTQALAHGEVWTLLTYTLLHASPFHLAGNCLALFFLGRELLPYLGEKRLLGLIAGSAIAGGLAWYAVHFARGGMLVGASSISAAFLVLYACFNPNRDITLLLFFVLPVTLKPKYLAGAVALFDLICLVASELPGGSFDTGVAHSAHIGGMIAGLFYFLVVHRREWRNPDGRTQIELPRWFRRARKSPELTPTKFKVDISNRADLRAEVDRILDKINSQGFGSLTPEEKKILDDAKDSLSRR